LAAWASLADKIVLTLDGNNSVQPVIRGTQAWFPSLRDAPRGTIVRIDLAHPGATRPIIVVPQQEARLAGVAGTKDALYLSYASGSSYMLARTGYQGGQTVNLPLPYEATIEGLSADPRHDAALVGLESWARPATYFQTDAAGVHDLHLAPPFAFDLSDIVTDTVFATAKDGTKIPISVSHRHDLKRDGSAPTLAEAYGAYGFSNDPVFHPEIIPFLKRGGVWAVAHVRGGGEFGEGWHLAGQGANKPNTWRDFIASVEALEADGFTSPKKLVGFGASAGGIMIGRTITERPDLLAGAVMWAPMVNMLRFETTEGGPANAAEFGSVKTTEGLSALRAMDAYSHVVDGTEYPAVLITIGLNDHRVPSWMGAEMAARLQAASSSGKPILLRVDDQGGHHVMGTSKADTDSQITDMLAFALMETGDPAFKPISAPPVP
jgi:prolyl oligopeptidase